MTAIGCLGLLAVSVSFLRLDAKTSYSDEYGVFVGYVPEEDAPVTDLNYEEVVIDAQYFSREQIGQLHSNGTTVYSYLNVGSLESFRDYCEDYSDLALGAYENWPEEQWMDVSDAGWQTFLAEDLAGELVGKAVDGFFLDNFDVYDVYDEEEGGIHRKGVSKEDIYKGLCAILQSLQEYGKPVIINGGDTFVQRYIGENDHASELITAVNQESVFSCVTDYDTESFGKNGADTVAYYEEYLEKCRKAGLEVYLLEYTKDPALIREIRDYCAEKGFRCWIAGAIELE